MPGFNPFEVTTKRVMRKLGGDKISAKKYTFDGNTEGRIVVPVGGSDSFVKISDDMPDLHKLVDLAYSSGGHATADAFTIQDVKLGDDTLYGAVGMIALGSNAPYVVVVTDTASSPIPETGLYTIMVGGSFWISSVEFAETIVPFDQKYLPGVCLPVVDLTGCALGEAITDETVITALNKCYAESPVIIGSIMTEGVTNLVFNRFVGMGFIASLMGGSISLVVSDGNWTLSSE